MIENEQLAALVDDIAGQRLELVFRDTTFTTPLVDDWLVEFIENAEFGRVFHAVSEALGPKEYERWKSLKPKINELQPFVNQIVSKLEAAGKG
jgi:hypothetical protein